MVAVGRNPGMLGGWWEPRHWQTGVEQGTGLQGCSGRQLAKKNDLDVTTAIACSSNNLQQLVGLEGSFMANQHMMP